MDKCPQSPDYLNSKKLRNTTIQNKSDFSGWLKKQGSKIKAYKKRYFILRGYSLYYYSNEDLNKLIGKISIRNVYIITDSDQNPDSAGFSLRPKSENLANKQIHLLAKSIEECHAWIKAIQKNLYLRHGGAQLRHCTSEFNYLPRIVYDCMKFILENGIKSEGIFRKCAQKNEILRLAEYYNQCQFQQAYEQLNPNVAAGLLKFYLRELPEPLIPYIHYDELKASGYRIDAKEDLNPVIEALEKLPTANYILLKELCIFLKKVSQHEKENLMSVKSLASVFSPNVLRQEEEDPKIEISASPLINTTLGAWIDYHQDIFLQDTRELFENFINSSLLKSDTNASLDYSNNGSNVSLDTLKSRSNSPLLDSSPPSNSPSGNFYQTHSFRSKLNHQDFSQLNGLDVSDHHSCSPNQTSPKSFNSFPLRRAWKSLRGVSSSTRSTTVQQTTSPSSVISTSTNNSKKSSIDQLSANGQQKNKNGIFQRPQRPSSPTCCSSNGPAIEEHKNNDFVIATTKIHQPLSHNSSLRTTPRRHDQIDSSHIDSQMNPQISWELRKRQSLLNRVNNLEQHNQLQHGSQSPPVNIINDKDHQSKNFSSQPTSHPHCSHQSIPSNQLNQQSHASFRHCNNDETPLSESEHQYHPQVEGINPIVMTQISCQSPILQSSTFSTMRRQFGSFSFDQKQLNRNVTLDELLDMNYVLPNLTTKETNNNTNSMIHTKADQTMLAQRTEDSINILNQSLHLARIEIAREKAHSERLSNQLSDVQGQLNLANLEIHFLQRRVRELEAQLNRVKGGACQSNDNVQSQTTKQKTIQNHLLI